MGKSAFFYFCSVTLGLTLGPRKVKTATVLAAVDVSTAATELAQRSKPGAILAQLRHMLFNVVLHGEVQHRAGLAGVCVLVSAPIVRRVAKMVH